MFFFTNNHVYRGKIRKTEKFQQLFIKKNLHVRVDFLFFSFSRMPAAPERRTVAAQAPKSVFPANTRGQESVSAEINYNDQRRDEQYQIIPDWPLFKYGLLPDKTLLEKTFSAAVRDSKSPFTGFMCKNIYFQQHFGVNY